MASRLGRRPRGRMDSRNTILPCLGADAQPGARPPEPHGARHARAAGRGLGRGRGARRQPGGCGVILQVVAPCGKLLAQAQLEGVRLMVVGDGMSNCDYVNLIALYSIPAGTYGVVLRDDLGRRLQLSEAVMRFKEDIPLGALFSLHPGKLTLWYRLHEADE